MSRRTEDGRRCRGGWRGSSAAFLEQVSSVLDQLREHWPLTLRQVYYQLVAADVIANSRNEYQKLSRVLAKARIDGLVPWEAIEDRVRSTLDYRDWPDRRSFVADELEGFLAGYRRDLLQSQDAALELWVEKDALSRLCHRVAHPYCVPVIVARGFSSVSYLYQCRRRVEWTAEQGKQTVVLYFGDLDPSGWEMLPAMLETLQHEMGLGNLIEGVRCALTPEQVAEFDLPHNPDAMKESDPRTRKYRDMLASEGHPDDLAVELDALPPDTLQWLVRAAIENHIDMEAVAREREREGEDHEAIDALRQRATKFILRLLEQREW